MKLAIIVIINVIFVITNFLALWNCPLAFTLAFTLYESYHVVPLILLEVLPKIPKLFAHARYVNSCPSKLHISPWCWRNFSSIWTCVLVVNWRNNNATFQYYGQALQLLVLFHYVNAIVCPLYAMGMFWNPGGKPTTTHSICQICRSDLFSWGFISLLAWWAGRNESYVLTCQVPRSKAVCLNSRRRTPTLIWRHAIYLTTSLKVCNIVVNSVISFHATRSMRGDGLQTRMPFSSVTFLLLHICSFKLIAPQLESEIYCFVYFENQGGM